jgi:hypothetical protein
MIEVAEMRTWKIIPIRTVLRRQRRMYVDNRGSQKLFCIWGAVCRSNTKMYMGNDPLDQSTVGSRIQTVN